MLRSSSVPEAVTRGQATAASASFIVALGVGVGVGVWFGLAGVSLWPLVVSVAVIALTAIAQFVSWSMSAAVTVMMLLWGQAVLMPVFPLTGLSLTTNNVVVLAGLGVIGVTRLWVVRRTLRLPTKDAGVAAVSAFVVPAVALAVACATVVRYEAVKISWAMGNDAVWNTMASRFIALDSGLVASTHPNPSPLANELMASIFSVGRAGVQPGQLLEHDISREIQVMLMLTIVTSVLASVAVIRVMSKQHGTARFIAAVGVGLIPWTWFIGGFAFRFGFYNVSLSVLALVALWVIWQEARRSPALGVAALLLSSTVLLAVWAPLVLLPSGLVLAAAIAHRRALLQTKTWHKTLLILSGLQLLVYGLFVTAPDLQRDGEALSANGAMIDISTFDVITAVALMLMVVTIGAVGRGATWDRYGVLIIVGAGALGIGYLIFQRLGINEPWGYYPAKFGWFLCILAAFVVVSSVAAWVDHTDGKPVIAALQVFVAAAAVGIILIQVPPSGWGAFSLFPALSITRADGMSGFDAEAQLLFDVSDPREKMMLVRYFPTPAQDTFVNGWLLQQPSNASSDPLRNFAYLLDTSSPVDVCAAISTWGGGVTLLSRDPNLDTEIRDTCPDEDFLVVTPPSGP